VLAAKLDHLDRQGLLEWSAKKVKLARRGHRVLPAHVVK